MQKNILEREIFYRKLIDKLREFLGSHIQAIIIFGSYIYRRCSNDIDVLVIIDKEIGFLNKQKIEYEVMRYFLKMRHILDIHIFDMNSFRENLRSGTFLSGLALGYETIYLKNPCVEKEILVFLKELSDEKYILYNKYGRWDLSHHAKITYNLKRLSQRKG